jgi:O-methyltransferase involved in polyketide biosynthesis
MYLPPDAVGALFKQCSAVSGAGSRIAFSYIGVRENGQLDAGPWSWMVLRMLRNSGEPWLWGIKPGQLGIFLGQYNWTFAPDLSPLTGKYGLEYFATAER